MDLTVLKVNYPELLFDRQRIYRISSVVDKNLTASRSAKLLVCYSSKTELTVQHSEMLSKLIAACKVSDADVQYLNLCNEMYSFSDLLKSYSPEVVLVFGEVPFRSNMATLFKNHIFEIGDSKLLRTDAIEDVFSNKKGEKNSLWAALKQLYKV